MKFGSLMRVLQRNSAIDSFCAQNRMSKTDPDTSARGVPKAYATPAALQAFSFFTLMKASFQRDKMKMPLQLR